MSLITAGTKPTSGTVDGSADKRVPKVLLVDDEPAILSALRRQLRGRYDIQVATDPIEALGQVRSTADLAVVVSDMRMPGMNGAQFLKAARDINPDAVRVLLTGHSEVEAAVAAINHGQIFRFLFKPASSDTLLGCLREAVRQYQLVTAERELLEQTLRGSVKALIDTLAMANPTVFSRAERVTGRLVTLAQDVDAPSVWEIELAGMLTHIGAVTLPPAISRRVRAGDELTIGEQELVNRLPGIAVSLLADIPRLENVREIIRLQNQRFDGHGHAAAGLARTDIPIGARLLRVVMAYDLLEARGLTPRQALHAMRKDTGSYDPALLAALAPNSFSEKSAEGISYIAAGDLRAGMVLADNITTTDGRVLCGKGQQLNDRLIELLNAWPRHTVIAEPIAVLSAADA